MSPSDVLNRFSAGCLGLYPVLLLGASGVAAWHRSAMSPQVWLTTLGLLVPLAVLAMAYTLKRIRPRDSGLIAVGGPVVALAAALAGLALLQTDAGTTTPAQTAWWLTAAALLAAIGSAPALMTESVRRRWVLAGALFGVAAVMVVGSWLLAVGTGS